MKTKYRVLILVSLLHLGLVFLGGCEINIPEGLLARALSLYGAVSGSNYGYGFFAPGVGGQLRASFDVEDREGKIIHTALFTGESHEAELRVQNIISAFSDKVKDETVRRSIAASWAGKVFARHPGAKSVLVKVETYDPPMMSDWREGLRSTWEPFYNAKFTRGSPKRSDGL